MKIDVGACRACYEKQSSSVDICKKTKKNRACKHWTSLQMTLLSLLLLEAKGARQKENKKHSSFKEVKQTCVFAPPSPFEDNTAGKLA